MSSADQGSPPAPTAEGWSPLADRIAGQARDFLDGVAALAHGEGGDEAVPLLLLEISQILLAGAQLGASKDVILPDNWEPDVGADPDLDSLRSGLARRLVDYDEYAELFDPYSDTGLTAFRLSDDLAAVAADLIHGLQHYEAGALPGSALVVAVLLRQPLGDARERGAAGPARGAGPRHARRLRGEHARLTLRAPAPCPRTRLPAVHRAPSSRTPPREQRGGSCPPG